MAKHHKSATRYLVAALILLFLLFAFQWYDGVKDDLSADILPLITSMLILIGFVIFLIFFFRHYRTHEHHLPNAIDHSTHHAIPSGLEHEPKHLNIHEHSQSRPISQDDSEKKIRHLVDTIQLHLHRGMPFSEIRQLLIDGGADRYLVEEAHRRYAFHYRRRIHHAEKRHPANVKAALKRRMPKIGTN